MMKVIWDGDGSAGGMSSAGGSAGSGKGAFVLWSEFHADGNFNPNKQPNFVLTALCRQWIEKGFIKRTIFGNYKSTAEGDIAASWEKL